MQPSRTGPFKYVPINRRPKLEWPNGARVALWVIPNVETFPLNEPIPGGIGKVPDVYNWSAREYGNRVGVYRIMDVLEKHGMKGSVMLNSEVCDDHPELIKDMVGLGWELLGHNQSNARYLWQYKPEDERKLVLDVFDKIEKASGQRPKGWLSSGLSETWNTLDYLIEAGGQYVCDWIADDQPYMMNVGGKQLVSVPYSGEINDLPAMLRGNHSPDEFDRMIRRQFDTLYAEGAQSGRVMAIALHPFIIGLPHRISALDSALRYILAHDGVWKTTGAEICAAWLKSAQAKQQKAA